MDKPFAQSSEENKQPILAVLKNRLSQVNSVLEIGSGTGQHAVYFGEQMPHLIWQTSDLCVNHPGIHQWLNEAGLENVYGPMELDVGLDQAWPIKPYQAVFSANTAHIMSESAVSDMFAGVGRTLTPKGLFLLYGPFKREGKHTAPSNQRFDLWLRQQNSLQGVRDIEWLNELAERAEMLPSGDIEMPVNNRILIWEKRD